MLINGGFEEWRDDDFKHRALVFEVEISGGPVIKNYTVDRGEVNNPAGWLTWYAHQRIPREVPWDHNNVIGWSEPEVRLTETVHGRQRSGSHAACLFTYRRIHECGLLQQVKVKHGDNLHFSAYAHGWVNNDDNQPPSCSLPGCDSCAWKAGTSGLNDDQRSIVFMVGIDPTGGLDPYSSNVVWGDGWHIFNGYKQLTVDAKSTGEYVTVFTKSSTLWPVIHNDAYWDDAELTAEGRTYRCTVNVLPQNATRTQVQEVLTKTYADRQTILYSHDDAARLTDKTGDRVFLWFLNPGELGTYTNWYCEHGSMATISIPGYVPPQDFNTLSFHLQERGPWEDILNYVRVKKPRVIKVFDGGMGREIKNACSDTKVVLRHYINNQDIERICSDPVNGTRWFFENISDDVKGMFARGEIDYLETPNNEANSVGFSTAAWVRADLEFVRQIRTAITNAKPVVATISVGCPHESEYNQLVELARETQNAGGAFGYHAYWPSSAQACYLESDWKWHAGRWCEMDKLFVSQGIEVDWILTESGPCGGIMHNRSDGSGWFEYDPGAGWKSEKCCGGDWSRAKNELYRFRALMQDWNKTHKGRCLGATIFTICGWDWENFRIEGEQIRSLTI